MREVLVHRKHAVFVYGTLKRGLSNHFFLREARFLGQAQTVERYALYEDEIPLVTRSQAVSP
ncbi:MAG TPA: gamma-glutamylcyclotransferase, partial [Desulfovibrio sp.]|nr:gamma-glutamylcyclotransferase [Desulfovibrio sp.]